MLLKNLPKEDMIHIKKMRIPAFLRVDKDVKAHQAKMKDNYDAYMEFDINILNNEIKKTLKEKVDEDKIAFIAHQDDA